MRARTPCSTTRKNALELSARERYVRSSMRRSPLFAMTLAAAFVAAIGSAACKRSAAREWRPDDHDQEQPSTGLQPAGSDAGGNPNVQLESDFTLAQAAWTSNCVQCHGRNGNGDGPQGPMVKAPNFADTEYMKQFTDEQLVTIVKNGRGKMPGFASIPDRVVRTLVAMIRSRPAPDEQPPPPP
jgi:cytochrome c oxidase cbb3-type subunit 3